jgi:hypothetical protein
VSGANIFTIFLQNHFCVKTILDNIQFQEHVKKIIEVPFTRGEMFLLEINQ